MGNSGSIFSTCISSPKKSRKPKDLPILEIGVKIIPRKLRTNKDEGDDGGVGVESFCMMEEGQEDSSELQKLEGKCKVSITMDEKQQRLNCTIRTCRECKMLISEKDAVRNQVKYFMVLKNHAKLGVFEESGYDSKSMTRKDQLRKDSPPQELFRIRRHNSCYDTYRFRGPIPKPKERLRVSFNLVVPDMKVTNLILDGIENHVEDDEDKSEDHLCPDLVVATGENGTDEVAGN